MDDRKLGKKTYKNEGKGSTFPLENMTSSFKF
jgi:hypothetical protein